jgi:hypothetical protein
MERLMAWLPTAVPTEDRSAASIVHGDFRVDNLIYTPDGAVAAVLVSVLCSAVQCSAVQCSAVQCSAVQCSAYTAAVWSADCFTSR